MKKFLLITCIALISMISNAQNGGQAAENSVIKLEFISYANYHTTVRITNKQNIPVDIELKSGSISIVRSFAALEMANMTLIGLQGSNVKIQAKPLNGEAGNIGIVELFLNITDLPVKFGEIKVKLTSVKN